jgi:hypothetical protein
MQKLERILSSGQAEIESSSFDSKNIASNVDENSRGEKQA